MPQQIPGYTVVQLVIADDLMAFARDILAPACSCSTVEDCLAGILGTELITEERKYLDSFQGPKQPVDASGWIPF